MFETVKIKNFLIKLVSCFYFSKKKRRKFRDSHLYLENKNNNQIIFIMKDGREQIAKRGMKNLHVIFLGKNNVFKIARDNKEGHINARFLGNGATVNILTQKPLNINMVMQSNSLFEIGKDSYINHNSNVYLNERGAQLIIGKNCAISWNTSFLATDFHTVLNHKKEITNKTQPIIIGDNVWSGCNTTFTKGVTIASNNIIGTSSVVTKSFLQSNCIIAGNPAKIVKQNISWDLINPQDYIQDK